MQVFLDVRFQSLDALEAAFVPTLTAKIQVKASRSGSSNLILVPDGDAGNVIIEPLSIEAFLFWGPVSPSPISWEGFVAVGHAETSKAKALVVDGAESQFTFLFPLTLPALSAMEEVRAGDKARFRIRLRMSGLAARNVQGAIQRASFSEDWIQAMRIGSNETSLEVERSQWVEEVLPKLGTTRWLLYEVPLLDVGEIPQADAYIERASKFYAEGEWKSSMQCCRDTVDVLRKMLRESATPAFTDERGGPSEKKLNKFVTAYVELVGSMQKFQGIASSIFSAGAHAEPLDAVVERADAEFALMVAYACRRYVALRLKTMKTPVFTRKPNELSSAGS